MMNNIIKYLEITILILASFSPLLPMPIKAAIVLFIVLINYKFLRKLNRVKWEILALFLVIFIVSFGFDLRNISNISQINILNLYFPLCIILGCIISEKYTFHDFIYSIDKVIFIISVLSLISVFLYTFIPDVVKLLPSYNYYHTTHKTAFIFNILIGSGNSVLRRNSGIAWEPGAFQLLVNLGLYAYLKTSNKTNLLKILIYSFVVITTRSTAGFVIFILITFKLAIEDKRIRYILIASVLAFGGFITEELIYQFRHKLFGSRAFLVRLEPLYNAFKEGKKHLLGIGNSGFDAFYSNENIPPWDSYGQIFIRYGYPLFILVIFRLLKLMKRHKILLAILLITFSSQNIWFFPLITPFYFPFRQTMKEFTEDKRKYEGRNDYENTLVN